MQQLAYAGYTCALCIYDIFEMISEIVKKMLEQKSVNDKVQGSKNLRRNDTRVKYAMLFIKTNKSRASESRVYHVISKLVHPCLQQIFRNARDIGRHPTAKLEL